MTDETNIDESTASAPNPGKKGRGNKWMPTDEQRRQVKLLSAIGTPLEDIAEIIGPVSVPTLRRACKRDLKLGKVEAKITARKTLFRMATDAKKPNVAALIFWLKCQDGWSEKPDALTGETPAKKEERRQKAKEIAGSGKLRPGAAPKLSVVK